MEKFIKAQFDASTRTMRAWSERNFVEFWTYTQEEYDEEEPEDDEDSDDDQ